MYYEGLIGRKLSVPSFIRKTLGEDKLLLMIGQAGENSEVAFEMLRNLVVEWINNTVSFESMIQKLQKAQISGPMTLHLLLILCVDQKVSLNRWERWAGFMEYAMETLVTRWVTDETPVHDVYNMLKLPDQSNWYYFDVRMNISQRFVVALSRRYSDNPNALIP